MARITSAGCRWCGVVRRTAHVISATARRFRLTQRFRLSKSNRTRPVDEQSELLTCCWALEFGTCCNSSTSVKRVGFQGPRTSCKASSRRRFRGFNSSSPQLGPPVAILREYVPNHTRSSHQERRDHAMRFRLPNCRVM